MSELRRMDRDSETSFQQESEVMKDPSLICGGHKLTNLLQHLGTVTSESAFFLRWPLRMAQLQSLWRPEASPALKQPGNRRQCPGCYCASGCQLRSDAHWRVQRTAGLSMELAPRHRRAERPSCQSQPPSWGLSALPPLQQPCLQKTAWQAAQAPPLYLRAVLAL